MKKSRVPNCQKVSQVALLRISYFLFKKKIRSNIAVSFVKVDDGHESQTTT